MLPWLTATGEEQRMRRRTRWLAAAGLAALTVGLETSTDTSSKTVSIVST